MECLSINLWNTNAPLLTRMERLSAYIDFKKPDVICMQEVSFVDGVLQIDFLHHMHGYNILYCKSGTWQGREEGLAIATKSNSILNGFVSLPTINAYNDMQRILMYACVEIEKQIVTVINTHLSYHIKSKENREIQAERIKNFIEQQQFENIILCGDFNRFGGEEKDFYSIVQDDLLNLQLIPYNTNKMEYSFCRLNEYVSKDLWPDRNIDYVFTSPNGQFTSSLCMNAHDGFLPCSDHYGVLAKGEFGNES